ncbi:MFS transporter [Patulibacter minatonensis]|uniref:MFS transporter n=1 Tax=Patulibacter minatonensis TaxID=298163 RepID=UPI000688E34B|nr:MFS transporter [Patulibacter minatonensis]
MQQAVRTSTPDSGPPALRRAWIVFVVGSSAYLIAMLHRMALGVAGSDAAERFGVAVGALGVFTSLQLVLYLVMQVPAGLLADRFGPRRTLAIGLWIMALGEILFAVAHSMPLGLVGRGLVGIGDALTFLNVLRLAHAWFPSRMQTMLTALIGFAGAVGQLVSTVPLELGLRHLGWAGTFLVVGGLTAVLALVPLALVRDRPPVPPDGAGDDRPPSASGGIADDAAGPATPRHEPVLATLAAAWRRPATRQGFFLHMGALSPFLIMAAIWGVPYMTDAQAMSKATAASYLLGGSIAFAVSGPLIALAVGSDARRQRVAALLCPAAATTAWAVLLLWPGAELPRGVLLACLLVTGFAAGGAMLAFEIARRAAPAAASASAGALVNCGGFSAAVIGSLLIGRLLGDGDHGAVATQHAMLPVLAFAAIGLIGLLLTRDPGQPVARAHGSSVGATGD